jgi:beta-galactosidase
LAGDGQLIDDLGTTTGSRVVQLYNGRAQITLRLSGHEAVACVTSDGLPTQFVDVTNTVSD